MKNNFQNIWAVGRNYAEHAKELNNPIPSEPMIFLKSGACVNFNSTIKLPSWCKDVHHELELALEIDENFNFSKGYLALDLTERYYQNLAKEKGQPWTLAKSFVGSCPLSHGFFLPNWSELKQYRIQLWVNDELRQNSELSRMINSPDALLNYLKPRFPIQSGDLILTGTPSGVGPIKNGDHLKAKIVRLGSEHLAEAEWTVSS